MSNFIERCNAHFYKIIAFIIFLVGVFTVNSTCDLIFYQPKESENLKRFCKNETDR
ncbi:MAG: cyclic lactone autoinducer peptide [Erysipelotrichaceae bacterium]